MQYDVMQGFEPKVQPGQKFEGKGGQGELERWEGGKLVEKLARAYPWKGCPWTIQQLQRNAV